MCEKYVIIVKLKSNQNSLEKAPATTPPPKKTCLINPDDSTNFPQYPPFIGDRVIAMNFGRCLCLISLCQLTGITILPSTMELMSLETSR